MTEATQRDEEKLRTIGEKLAALWEQGKIMIMWVSTLAAVLGTTWTLSASQAEIKGQITNVATTVGELKSAFTVLAEKHEQANETIGVHAARLATMEEWKRSIHESNAELKLRMMAVEYRIWGVVIPPKVTLP